MEAGKVEFRLFSGVVAYVTPLSVDTMQLVRDKVNAIDADWQDEFKKPLEGGVDDDMTFIDDKDPQYRVRMAEVGAKRSHFQRGLLADICIEFDRSQDELIKEFAQRLNRMRKHFGDNIPSDDWEATLHHAVVVRPEEWAEMTQVIFSQTPIQEVEIRDQMRIFRPVVPVTRLLDINRDTPSVHGEPGKSTG